MLPPYRHAPNGRLMGLGLVLGVVTVLLALDVVSFAFARIGVSSRHRAARLVPGLGVAVPALVPPLVAAVVSVAVAGHGAAPVAYVAGTLGSLIGADLANIPRLAGLGAPVASIGGGGTFDGVFLAGVVAVVLVAVL